MRGNLPWLFPQGKYAKALVQRELRLHQILASVLLGCKSFDFEGLKGSWKEAVAQNCEKTRGAKEEGPASASLATLEFMRSQREAKAWQHHVAGLQSLKKDQETTGENAAFGNISILDMPGL